ncbi:sulfate adenylyltransferase subunit CysN [Chromobacterium subtsugae]|uniref:Sulfate adenylyltransferase subunit 1 n=1 Tax=Chromobacterium subtsugae TaxID=251747 RepID=A0ABS7FD65_9NEIS|nr:MULTISPECIES: sulfate adenylyltransferase subunit CysN [Chromobacterium]KUM05133.1 sulfate adenylyltransferase [Chromobacterium subtsugae]KZE88140.1 sulfate adenylyltransferase [Chromobacterium sp. F49]MBW7565689.1 sulfate adenylyltransferase subunit CysN [Chromobacterium subtsugae]MBW8288020.1 sulfate adenylyltransferase subunit CysN [Chromobacterium subtsugae]OBU86840.1 sulfate adenylyltransferase [Chromobacterium subtsugae]
MSHQSELISGDILEYLRQHENKDMLRFITCGSVDDGKSTLIGRLLHDSKLIFEDQLAAIERDSKKYNTTDQNIDLALLVDGLQAEREQGITIDVAYRYFSTDKRKFIIADCPGHEQYTRNMATGASTSNLAIILIDARRGVQTQTRRHSYIVSLLGIRHVIVAVNKMDLVDYDESVFNRIRDDYLTFAEHLDIPDIHFVPLSALRGDNVVSRSEAAPWYQGPTLMHLLETIQVSHDVALDAFRLPVQYVNRPNLDFRGFCGTVASGSIHPGDRVVALPSGKQSRVKEIVTYGGQLPRASSGQAITLTLEDEIDISRGDMLVRADEAAPHVSQSFDAHLVAMGETPLRPGKEYGFKLAGKYVTGRIESILHRTDVNTLQNGPAEALALNEIGLCRISLNSLAVFDSYRSCRGSGSLILIDRLSNGTVAAGMIGQTVESAVDSQSPWQRFEQELSQLLRKHYPDMTLAQLAQRLAERAGD